jgi:hypothetical protein
MTDAKALFIDTNILIVAAMQAYGIPALLTHNTQDFERFGKIITEVTGLNPDHQLTP